MATPMLDIEALKKKARAKGKPPKADVEVDVEPEDTDPESTVTEEQAEAGDRAIAAHRLGDGKAFAQAVLDILNK